MSEIIKKYLGDLYTPEVASKLEGKQFMEYVGEHSPIPYDRFKAVNDKKNGYEVEVENLTKSIKTLEDSTDDVEGIKKQLSTVTANFDNYKTEIATKAELERKMQVATKMFSDANALSPKLLFGLVDFNKVTIDDESNNTLGLQEQVDKIQLDYPGQFGKVDNQTPPPKHGGNNKVFADLTSTERMKWKEDDPKGYEAARNAYKATR